MLKKKKNVIRGSCLSIKKEEEREKGWEKGAGCAKNAKLNSNVSSLSLSFLKQQPVTNSSSH